MGRPAPGLSRRLSHTADQQVCSKSPCPRKGHIAMAVRVSRHFAENRGASRGRRCGVANGLRGWAPSAVLHQPGDGRRRRRVCLAPVSAKAD